MFVALTHQSIRARKYWKLFWTPLKIQPILKMICHQVKEVNSKEELQAIFQNNADMDVLMNTGFTSTISLEKKDTIVRYNVQTSTVSQDMFYRGLF